MSSVTIIMTGMFWLGISLIAAYAEPSFHQAWIQWIGGWLGSILVIAGTGKLFFLDD